MLELLDQKRADLAQRFPFEVVLKNLCVDRIPFPRPFVGLSPRHVNLVNELVELHCAGLNQAKPTFKDLLLDLQLRLFCQSEVAFTSRKRVISLTERNANA
jgi:hypothetical protein